MICTRKLAETIALGFSCLTAEHETRRMNVRLWDTKAYTLTGCAPKAYDLPDRFEDVDELILCSTVKRVAVWVILGLEVPRPCCRGWFQLTGRVSGRAPRLRAKGVPGLTERDFTHCGGFDDGDRCDRDCAGTQP